MLNQPPVLSSQVTLPSMNSTHVKLSQLNKSGDYSSLDLKH